MSAHTSDTIKYLIKWAEFENFLIVDVCQKSYDLALEYAVQHYFYGNFVYEKLGIVMEDGGEQNFRRMVTQILRNESSIMVITQDEKTIVGIGLLMIMTTEWRSWICLQQTISRNSGFFDILTLQIGLMFNQALDSYDETYDNMFIHGYTATEYLLNDKTFMQLLFGTFINVTRHMKQSRVVTVAMTITDQQLASEAGFQELEQTIYSIYKVGDDRRPFDILRTFDEMCSFVYELSVPPVVSYLEMPGFEAYHEKFDRNL